LTVGHTQKADVASEGTGAGAHMHEDN